MRKYLEDIEYDSELEVSGERADALHKEKEAYGFDSSETWSLDTSMTVLLYERLMMFKEVSGLVDHSFNKVTIDEETLGLDVWIDRCIELSRKYLTTKISDDDWDEAEQEERLKRVWKIWSHIVLFMWW